MTSPTNLIPCDSCGAYHQAVDLQRIEIHLKGELICKDCVKRVLLIAGQVQRPGWIAYVAQPRNLSQIASRKYGLMLSREEVAELCELGRDECMKRLHEAYNEFWDDCPIEDFLKDKEIIDIDNRENIA